ncbi:MAG: endonuclease [Bacteroidetes bacterium OLB11]|nr:MAG: endonuclease [Bacteroidetes bacterium OLB11]
MKYRFFTLLIILFVSAKGFAQSDANKKFAIAFYNLENFYDTINDPNTDDDEFTPNGANAYTPAVFKKK